MNLDSPAFVRLQAHLGEQRATLLARWKSCVWGDDQVETAISLSRREFFDHIPQILALFESSLNPTTPTEAHLNASFEAASEHGDHRWQQGYTTEEIAREWGHLNLVVLDEIEAFCLQNFAPEEQAEAVRARRIWARLVDEGITLSASRFDQLQREQAQGRMNDLESLLSQTRIFERERGAALRHATHDLRGSLSVVRGATSLMDWRQIEKLEREESEKLFRMLSSGVQSLHEMMADLLDLARLEAGAETLEIAHFDVGELLGELHNGAQPLAREKQLEFRKCGPPNLRVEGDAVKVQRIAQNLLLNALKYTPSGHVSLEWRPLSEDRWQLEISDSGVGIDGEKPSDSNDLNTPSEGVGLSIVKRLCELCHATLFVESSENGSCFRVIFPTKLRAR